MSYAWEKNIDRSWEQLQEDEDGVLRATESSEEASFGGVGRLRRQASQLDGADDGQTLCRNMIRYLCVVVDTSRAMSEADLDMRPSRRIAVSECLKEFLGSFFDENPLSNLALFASKDGVAIKLSEMSSSPNRHLDALEALSESGEFSMQNGLELAKTTLQSVPKHGSKEILVIMGSLSTCDQGDVFETIDGLMEKGVRCSVIGLCAEVYVAKYLTEKTKGLYGVSKDRNHFRRLLFKHVPPPPVLNANRNDLRCTFVRMGFPSQGVAHDGKSSASGTTTSARLTLSSDTNEITAHGYYCPRCQTVCTELPCKCPICHLELIASSHLARSYHHLFPVPRFVKVTLAEAKGSICVGCSNGFATAFDDAYVTPKCYKCPKCDKFYCEACEAFIHETLHNCVGCLEMKHTHPQSIVAS